MTTQSHSDGIPVTDEGWVRGGSRKDAYVSPWYVTTIKHRDLDDQQWKLSDSLVADTVEALHDYSAVSSD
jgi:hypothetical protein